MHWPLGWRAGALRAGLYPQKKNKKDLALFYSEVPARAAGVFTRSTVKAAPVLLSRMRLEAGAAKAVLLNSGCANACTGSRGLKDAGRCAGLAARSLGIPPRSVLLASTGVIGTFLPMKLLERAIPALGASLRGFGAGAKDGLEAARAIMTTDTRPKTASLQATVGGVRAAFWGCAKGAGMIHPRMATMLAVVLTDAAVAPRFLQGCLARAVEETFNRVSVDGETSTNDTVFLLANGAAGGPTIRNPQSPGAREFSRGVLEVCRRLSRQIAEDGEGASKSIWIFVEGARTKKEATRLAEAVAVSPLVKTAVYGADANWGRIMGAMGKTEIPFNPSRVEVRFGDYAVCRNGMEVPFDAKSAKKILNRPRVTLRIRLNQGKAWSHYQTCDFTGKYVDINAGYRS